MYTLHKEIEVSAPLMDVWDFISHPANLDRITPGDMEFQIVSRVPEKMFNGLLIEYRVRLPFIGWKVWVSELKHIDPGVSFVDEQRIGPYRFWYHEHRIEPSGGCVKIIDHVSYEVPLGILGKMAHPLFVRPLLERIFQHREKMFHTLLSPKASTG